VTAVERPLIEAIIIAHELGHVQLDRERGDVAGDRAADEADRVARFPRDSGGSVTEESVSAYYAEEECAWEIGREILRRHGLEQSAEFEDRRRVNLKTYEDAIRARLPGWHPDHGT
jgi:hypothetical protein